MKTTLTASAVAMMMGGLLSLAAADWKAPRTPWGEPDLQGTWTSQAELGVPFERPAAFGTRQPLTDEEFAQREAQAQNQLQERQRRLRPRDGRHLARGTGRLGDVAAADVARARQGVAAHLARHRSAGRPGTGHFTRRPAPSAGRGPGRARQRTVRRPGEHGPLPAVHHARRAERDVSGGLQRQHAHRAGAGVRRRHVRDDSRDARHPHDGAAAPDRRRARSIWATRADTGTATRSSSTSRTSTRRATTADRAPACTWSSATSGRRTADCATR